MAVAGRGGGVIAAGGEISSVITHGGSGEYNGDLSISISAASKNSETRNKHQT